MESHKNEIELRISSLIKNNRQKLAMSQHELADGICSQPMISSIERGDYLPNAALFMKLCIRLNISLDQSFLSSELPIGSA
ncbi:helix-turn-helix domain-containing protein [Weissella confusa]|uniref:helix-turn-helix domain-containing protein n=1 Tax=Weissella confusa TaxID=1583 RepID=UPI0022FE7BDA|nr:helix-turn-helix transcriptional regulator [Weissella confusa]